MSMPTSCLELLQEMIAIESINQTISGRAHPEAELGAYLEVVATAWGLGTRRLDVGGGGFNLLVWHEVAPNAPWLLLESHMDTVGVEGMTVDPFHAHIEESRLYGRGACDTKGSGAAMLWALRGYRDNAESGANNVALLFSVDEEDHKAGVDAFVARHLPVLGWMPRGAIVGEPTQLKPVVAHNGVVRWSIRTHGLAAHSSDPTRGRSAIRMMVQVIEALETQYIARLQAAHPLTGVARCSINIIRGGSVINIIPDECEIWLDRRIVPGEDARQVLPEVERVLENLRAQMPDLSYSMTKPYIDQPLDPAGGEAFFAIVQGVLCQAGLSTELVGVGYGSDGSTLRAAGIPVVLLGPGHIAQAHAADEYLELGQLAQAQDLYGRLMRAPAIDGVQ